MSDKVYVYFANATLDDGTEVAPIDLEERGWADKAMLARTRRWSLVPKDGARTLKNEAYPIVSIAIPGGAKPVFRSRVYHAMIASRSSDQIARKVIPVLLVPEFRAYSIGWKKGRTSVWTWVLPDGSIEVTTSNDECHLGDVLRHHLNSVVAEIPEPEPVPEPDPEPEPV